jgi:hypothetical protein
MIALPFMPRNISFADPGGSPGSPGNTAGSVLNTDIRVYINGVEIAGYNIGGRTYIIAEDLRAYGFSVVWNSPNRTLSITRGMPKGTVKRVPLNTEKQGSAAFEYIYTDILAYIEGKPVQSFNIKGQTVICVDDLVSPYGYSVWNRDARTLKAVIPGIIINSPLAGSNQEWALWALAQSDNGEEKIRLYNWLVEAYTELMAYDMNDYIDEYEFVKYLWTNNLSDYDEYEFVNIQRMLDDENWYIDIWYPLETPFKVTRDEYLTVSYYVDYANPQFFLTQRSTVSMNAGGALKPGIVLPAYYAFADRRQEPYNNILNSFNDFVLRLKQSVDINDQYEVVRYVYSHVVDTLLHDNTRYNLYRSREQTDRLFSILGYFGETKATDQDGYAKIVMYLLNRLGIPAINLGLWNMVKLDGNWYYLDTYWEWWGEYNWFLKGRGENNDSHLIDWHGRGVEMIFPEAAVNDYIR